MDLPVASRTVESGAHDLSLSDESRDLKDPSLYINRELGWLDFNRRVLAQATDPAHPLLERVKFLGITAGNLDEFFMIRMANALRKVRNGIEDRPPDGLSAAAQLAAMRDGAYRMMDDQAATWATLRLLLERENIVFLDAHDWDPQIRTHLGTYFAREVFPALTPLAFDPGHPFPFISNLSTNLAVAVEQGGRMKFARVKVPPSLPRFVELPPALAREGTSTFVFLEDVIKANVQALFPGLPVKGAHLFRIVRDSDLEIDQDDSDDLLETVDRSLRRLRYGALSLLQVEADMPERTLDILVDNFETTSDIVVRTTDRLGLRDWIRMTNLPRPDLKYPPLMAPRLWRDSEDPEAVFDLIRYQDVVLHHPFESFGTVETFLRAAVRDPLVIAIKMTLYRIGPQSPLVPLLIEAAEAGKQVAVLVELKARLDERNNIIWARQLESHGIHVSYGFPNLKTHLKLCLVVRQGPNGVRQFVHTSSGNYNPTTAKIYTDIGIITSDPDIVADVADVFNTLTGYSNQAEYRGLVVAPAGLRKRLVELIDREAEHARQGRPARLIIKVNALTDDQMIRTLYRASQSGLDIELIVRGVCCLRPGIPGISDRIHVRSVLGRFLEHSRIYWFLNGGAEEMYIGSADLMERNLDRRVEMLYPVRDRDALSHLRDIVLGAYLRDTERAMVLESSGAYVKARGGEPFDAQAFLTRHYSDAIRD
jgi:polyphosphate kinase